MREIYNNNELASSYEGFWVGIKEGQSFSRVIVFRYEELDTVETPGRLGTRFGHQE